MHRTRTRAKSENDVEGVSRSALGSTGRDRFLHVEVWTCSGLTRFVVLFFLDLSTRRVEIGGIASSANGLWMTQIARNVTDVMDNLFGGSVALSAIETLCAHDQRRLSRADDFLW
jgi:hypothetical protein